MEKETMGLYIHIPFCIQKCKYCDFLSQTGDSLLQQNYMKFLIREMEMKADNFKDYKVNTIFIGGGTPSVIEAQELEQFMKRLFQLFCVDRDAEITIESNPGTLTKRKLEQYRACGINRLSIGLQTTDAKELAILGRIHTFEQFLESYYLARQCGFHNINIDLMLALPNQTHNSFVTTLEKTIALNPEHLSVYSLIIEEGTPFYEMYQKDYKLRERGDEPLYLPSEEVERAMYDTATQLLERAGYMQYEISNYGKLGYECKHNKGYWIGSPYIGIGLGASSYWKGQRIKNHEELDLYLQGNFEPEEISTLSKESQMEEFMFLGLRLLEGISRAKFHELFFQEIEVVYGSVLKSLKEDKFIWQIEDKIGLTKRGIDLSNYVLAQFLL